MMGNVVASLADLAIARASERVMRKTVERLAATFSTVLSRNVLPSKITCQLRPLPVFGESHVLVAAVEGVEVSGRASLPLLEVLEDGLCCGSGDSARVDRLLPLLEDVGLALGLALIIHGAQP